ncbi:F0F1 ATP synthase subunit B [Enterobacteriaceae endosymbiont of Plateumaris pusilla]|uniref:F0F1 ATP synthase subunit B n=1 Tax=Enterobacteriaceae endosymbiont of Plateumaris pusilla TaxID=2675795 RepID=UPI001449F924|nr:F0F1 ATP synthase subunit B [Enterobacteriaceae endosymbiont of Plateumaris pusilla]QJC29687.1 F0F1 ATP synthase subunit B [Enterobacteriaceae endosymbiont of Plateumaris pusilla]
MNINATIIGQAITFILIVIFCMYYIWPPIILAIKNRQKEIKDKLLFIDKAKKDIAIAENNIYLEKNKAHKEYKIIIKKAQKLSNKIINEAYIESKKIHKTIIKEAKREIEYEYILAHESLKKETVKIAISIAEKIIEDTLKNNKNYENNLFNSFINKL